MTLPPPLVTPDVDLRDFSYTPVFRSRLFGSSFHAHTSDAGWRAGVTLWLKSWDQTPAGSLPDNDVELCRLAELGRDLTSWAAVKDEAMWGWSAHSDGRLYHKIVAEGVNKAWQEKVAQRNRTAAARKAKLDKQPASDATHSVTEVVTECVTDNPTDDETETVTGSKGSKVKGRDSSRRATRLPDDWIIPDDWRAAARASGLSDQRIDYQSTKFKNYYLSISGNKATKLNWRLAWNNWIIDDVASAKSIVAARPSRPQMDEAMDGIKLDFDYD